MSDGNFNRSLLPHTPYHSGLQAGKAMARMQAIETFKCYLATLHPDFTEEERKEQTEIFKKMLSARLSRKNCPIPFPHNTNLLIYNRVYIK